VVVLFESGVRTALSGGEGGRVDVTGSVTVGSGCDAVDSTVGGAAYVSSLWSCASGWALSSPIVSVGSCWSGCVYSSSGIALSLRTGGMYVFVRVGGTYVTVRDGGSYVSVRADGSCISVLSSLFASSPLCPVGALLGSVFGAVAVSALSGSPEAGRGSERTMSPR
jgi:hypothetical protein